MVRNDTGNMTTEDLLIRFTAQQGWNLDSQLTVLLRYIENQQDDDAFEEFLQQQADLENGIGQGEDDEPGLNVRTGD